MIRVHSKFSKSAGFSIIEIAVILTVIALIVGGILAGQSLIRTSELQSIISDLDNYKKAFETFKDKYGSLPGDMNNATNFWGTDPNGCPSPYNADRKRTTCNGNANGRIDTYPENFRAWQQLSNASIIPGSFTGAQGNAAADDIDVGINVPEGSISGTGFSVGWIGLMAADADRFDGNYRNVLYFGTNAGNGHLWQPAISTEDALSIDLKVDDGKPAYGKILTWKSSFASAPGCASTDVSSSAVYATATTGIRCSLIYLLGF